ncbi:MAG TPA: type II 3-dehydroquinate dehydratase [Candidatus Nitrosotalea sp.]|nr:type II 3-dehydroquinate dehydratase [Candidatus Nitrosotalea sp.]
MSQAPARILVVNGPNLNLLGTREPEVYGTRSLADLESDLRRRAAELGCEIEFAQSNSESEIIDLIQAARERVLAVILNPGALAHYSYAIADAIRSTALPVFEVHLSNIFAREEFRQRSVVAPAAVAVITGAGFIGYELALEAALRLAR